MRGGAAVSVMKKMDKQKIWKPVLVSLAVLLGLAAMLKYNDIDALIKHYFLKEPVVRLDNGTLLYQEPKDNPADYKGNITPEQFRSLTPVGGSVDVLCYAAAYGTCRMEYTLNGVTLYDNIAAAGIAVSECTPAPDLEKYLRQDRFMLVDMTVKFLEVVDDEVTPDDALLPFIINVQSWSLPSLTGVMDENSDVGARDCYTWYFSEHPYFEKETARTKYYYYFDLSPGESLDFQLGIAVPQVAAEKKAVYLRVQDSGSDFFTVIKGFKLFD